ncbi:hypothetical protein KM043_001198 [Ampulex compressa]|nr:hypothetical protein KM043_001198 [Ampulex compressa]
MAPTSAVRGWSCAFFGIVINDFAAPGAAFLEAIMTTAASRAGIRGNFLVSGKKGPGGGGSPTRTRLEFLGPLSVHLHLLEGGEEPGEFGEFVDRADDSSRIDDLEHLCMIGDLDHLLELDERLRFDLEILHPSTVSECTSRANLSDHSILQYFVPFYLPCFILQHPEQQIQILKPTSNNDYLRTNLLNPPETKSLSSNSPKNPPKNPPALFLFLPSSLQPLSPNKNPRKPSGVACCRESPRGKTLSTGLLRDIRQMRRGINQYSSWRSFEEFYSDFLRA